MVSDLVASPGVAVDLGVEFETALPAVMEVEGWNRRVPEVATEGVGGWASRLRHRCVHLDAAAEVSCGVYSAVGMRDETVDATWKKI